MSPLVAKTDVKLGRGGIVEISIRTIITYYSLINVDSLNRALQVKSSHQCYETSVHGNLLRSCIPLTHMLIRDGLSR